MGTRTTASEDVVAIFDSVTGWAFGPTFENQEDAESFLEFAARDGGRDVRTYDQGELEQVHIQWLRHTGRMS